MSSTELPRACWWWLPLTLGLSSIPSALVPVTVFLVLGGWWRHLCLRRLRTAGADDGMLRIWRAFLALWCVAGLAIVVWIVEIGSEVLPDESMARALAAWDLWRWMALLEMLLATAWISSGASRRESRWAAVLVTAGFGASLIAVLLQDLTQRIPSGPVTLLLGTIRTAGGLAGPLLIADAGSRLLQSMSSESLDEETEDFGQSGPRLP